MSALMSDEISMEDPLCDSSFGSMVTLDYVTPDTEDARWRSARKVVFELERWRVLGRVRGKSGEYIVGDRSVVWKARSLQRKPLGQRWDPESIKLAKFFPFNFPGDPNADVDVPKL